MGAVFENLSPEDLCDLMCGGPEPEWDDEPPRRKGEITRDRIMEFVRAYKDAHDYVPSIREIGEGIGLRSTGTVQRHMTRLMAEGRLETDHPYSPRAYRIAKEEKERSDSKGRRGEIENHSCSASGDQGYRPGSDVRYREISRS